VQRFIRTLRIADPTRRKMFLHVNNNQSGRFNEYFLFKNEVLPWVKKFSNDSIRFGSKIGEALG